MFIYLVVILINFMDIMCGAKESLRHEKSDVNINDLCNCQFIFVKEYSEFSYFLFVLHSNTCQMVNLSPNVHVRGSLYSVIFDITSYTICRQKN